MIDRLHDKLKVPNAELAAAYAHLDLFQEVDFERVGHLVARCKTLDVAESEVILTEGNANTAVYQILSGCLQVRLDGVAGTPLVTLEAGACVGELSILSRLDVSATVVALAPSRLLVIHDHILWALIRSSHEFAANLLDVLSGRVRNTNDRLRHTLHAQEQSARAARLDPLTGLYNRRWLDETLVLEWRRCQAEDLPFSVLLLDIDHFKRINDEHGHLVGDEVLRILAARLRHALRAPALAARYGGEEFVALLPGIGSTQARDIAGRFQRNVSENVLLAGNARLRTTVSIGIAEAGAATNPREVLNAADVALYHAKRDGRDRVVVAGDSAGAPRS